MSEQDEEVEPHDAMSHEGTSATDKSGEPTGFSPSFDEVKSHESVAPINSYQIKPNLQEKFKEMPVKEILRYEQNAILGGKNYDAEHVKKWTINMANEINQKVKDLEMKRYKHIVQVLIGERKGQGVKSGVRCLWDCDVDGYTSEIFMNETALYLCGGSTPKESIKRGLSKIFSNRLARRCSWTGRKENLPLKSLQIMDILKAAVRKQHTNLTDKEFVDCVSIWFRQAELRYRRELASAPASH